MQANWQQDFKAYLCNRGYSERTRGEYERAVRQYLGWFAGRSQSAESASYRDVLLYLAWCRSRGVRRVTLERYLRAVGHWYVSKGLVNPGRDITLRVEVESTGELLSEEELRSLYDGYRSIKGVSVRNTVVVGLMVFQGLHSGHLGLLRARDVDVVACRLHVPGSRRSNERWIALEASQIVPLGEYTQGVSSESSLIGGDIRNIVEWLFVQLQKLDSRAVNALVLRRSVIAHWIGRYGLRQVQYLAGHKCIGSTESYQGDSIGTLLSEVERLHPLHR